MSNTRGIGRHRSRIGWALTAVALLVISAVGLFLGPVYGLVALDVTVLVAVRIAMSRTRPERRRTDSICPGR